MEIPPDLELAIASQMDAERQFDQALKYLVNARASVNDKAIKAHMNSCDIEAAFHQMRTSLSAKQVHKLTSE